LLIDEADAVFAGNSERNEDLRGVLNAGNAPGSPVIRGGKDGTPVSYDVFSPKVIAGIATGKLPDTIRDRSIAIPMDRKLRTERVERLRRRQLQAETDALRGQLGAWAQQRHDPLVEYDLPAPLEKISDRLEEAWEPLLAIADLAGAEYPEKARAAALELAGEGEDDAVDASHTLLMALKGVFGQRDAMWTRDIIAALNQNDELPFGSWSDGAGIKAAEMARLLKGYRVRPGDIRIGSKALKGYRKKWFKSAWERYGGDFAATPATSQQPRAFSGFSEPRQDAESRGQKSADIPYEIRDVAEVAAKSAPTPSDSGYRPATSEEEALAERLLAESDEP